MTRKLLSDAAIWGSAVTKLGSQRVFGTGDSGRPRFLPEFELTHGTGAHGGPGGAGCGSSPVDWSKTGCWWRRRSSKRVKRAPANGYGPWIGSVAVRAAIAFPRSRSPELTTVHDRCAGVESVFPFTSVAATVKVCEPGASPM